MRLRYGGHWFVVVATVLFAFSPKPVLATRIDNGSFETGTFAGWIVQDLSVPFFPLRVGGSNIGPGFGFFLSAPTDGIFAALHGFDGNGPGLIRIAQDISVTEDGTIIEFDYRAAWNLVSFCFNCSDRIFEVNIEVEGGGVNLASSTILIATARTIELDTGNTTGTIDLSDFVGETVRLSFDFFVPQNFAGPAFFQLDNVRVVPAAWIGNGAVLSNEHGQQSVSWKEIVGIREASNLVGTGAGRITGDGQPWSARGGRARLNLRSGFMEFSVQSLVLAGGNGIGTPGSVTHIRGTLVCDTDGSAGGDSVIVNTPAVELSGSGDARFEGNIGPLPDQCFDERDIAFLIRTATVE